MFVEGGSELPQRSIWSNESLIEWLEGKNPDERYSYTSHCDCLIAQYFKAMGAKKVLVTNKQVWFYNLNSIRPTGQGFDLPHKWDMVAMNGLTFGYALKLAKQHLKVGPTEAPALPTSESKPGWLGRLASLLIPA